MRWIKYLSLAIYLLLSLTACTVSAPAPEERLLFAPNDIADYVTIRSGYKEGELSVHYPTVRGLADSELQNSINERIKQEALVIIESLKDGYGEPLLRVDYDIMMSNNRILSIKYYGYYDRPRVAHPTHLNFATNIDLTTGELISLEDLFIINLYEYFDKNIFDYVYGYDPELDSEETISYWYKHATQTELSKIFQNHGAYYASDSYIDDFFFTKNKLHIIANVSHALGDRLEVVANYADLQQWMDMDNPIWQQLE